MLSTFIKRFGRVKSSQMCDIRKYKFENHIVYEVTEMHCYRYFVINADKVECVTLDYSKLKYNIDGLSNMSTDENTKRVL